MCKGGGGGGDGGAAAREAERQLRINDGYAAIQRAFGGFGDDFYNSRAQAYTDYATPQLDKQYEEAVKNLEFALARNNRLDSSVAGDQRAKLLEDYNMQKTAVADRGNQYANDARRSVEASRGDLMAMNSGYTEAYQLGNEANARMGALNAMPAFDPLGPLFVNAGEALGSQAELERRSNAKYNSGLFTPPAVGSGAGSGKVIN